MDFAQIVFGVLVFGAAAAGCRKLFFNKMEEYDELEQAFLSLAMAFFGPVMALVFINLGLQLPASQPVAIAVFAMLAIAPYAVEKVGIAKAAEEEKREARYSWHEKRHAEPEWLKDWRVQYAFVGLAMAAFLFLATPYFAKTTMWMDEGMDENMAGHLLNGELFKDLEYNYRNPVNPIGLSALYSLFGKEDAVVYGYNFFLALLSIGLVYLLGRRVFGVVEGMVAALLLAFNTLFLFYSLRFLTEISQIAAVALFAFFFFQVFKEGRSNKLPLLAFAAGVLFVTKYTLAALFFGGAAAVLLFRREEALEMLGKEAKRVGVAVALAVAVVLPIFVFNYVKTGSPAGVLLGFFSGISAEGSSPLFAFVTMAHLVFSTIFVVILVLVAMLLAYWNGDKAAMQVAAMFAVAFAVTSAVLTLKVDRYIMFLDPLAFLLAGYAVYLALAGASRLVWDNGGEDALASAGKAAIAILCLAILWNGTIETIGQSRGTIEYSLPSYQVLQFAGKAAAAIAAPGETIASTSGPELGYYAQRETVFIPHNLTELKKKFAEHEIRVVVLTVTEPQTPVLYAKALEGEQTGQTGNPQTDFEYFRWGNDFELVQEFTYSDGQKIAWLYKRK